MVPDLGYSSTKRYIFVPGHVPCFEIWNSWLSVRVIVGWSDKEKSRSTWRKRYRDDIKHSENAESYSVLCPVTAKLKPVSLTVVG